MVSISTIVPVYNRASSIVETIDSVLGQRQPPDELIVVDDGSTDDIEEKILTFKDQIKFIRQANAGVASARNTGIRHSSGDWITFLDSDDLWNENRMEVLRRDLPSATGAVVCHLADVVYTGRDYSRNLFEVRKIEFPRETFDIVEDPLSLVLSGMTLQGSAIRRDAFFSIGGFDEGMRMLSDTDLFCQLALIGDFMVTGETVATIRRIDGDENSITAIRKSNAKYAFSMHIHYLSKLYQKDITEKQKLLVARSLSGAHMRAAESEMRTGKLRVELEHLVAASRLHPSAVIGYTKSGLAFTTRSLGYALLNKSIFDRS